MKKEKKKKKREKSSQNVKCTLTVMRSVVKYTYMNILPKRTLCLKLFKVTYIKKWRLLQTDRFYKNGQFTYGKLACLTPVFD